MKSDESKKLINDSTAEKNNKKYFYWGVHFSDAIFFIILIVFISLDAVGVFKSEECTYVCETIDDITECSLSCEQNESWNLSIEIVSILIPLLVTVLTLSFALLPKDLCGVPYAEFRKFGSNRAYPFLCMVLISITLFVASAICVSTELYIAAILIDAISLFYVVYFFVLEIPMLSRSTRKINRLLRTAFYRVYEYKETKFVKKETLNTAISFKLQDSGLLETYNALIKKNESPEHLTYETLLNILSDYLMDYVYRGTMPEKTANNFLKSIVEYLNSWTPKRFASENYKEHIYNVSIPILKFIRLLRLDDAFNQLVLKQLLSMLILGTDTQTILRGKGFVYQRRVEYGKDRLLRAGILNYIITHSFAQLNFNCIKCFIEQYTVADMNDFQSLPDINYLIFISLYIYYLQSIDHPSGEFELFYEKIMSAKNYKQILLDFFTTRQNAGNALRQAENRFNENTVVLLLKYFLDFYRSVGDEKNGFNRSWCILPKNFVYSDDYLIEFNPIQIYAWWITFLFCCDILPNNVASIKGAIDKLLDKEDINALLRVYSLYWTYEENDGEEKFKPLTQYEKYFTELGLSFDYESKVSYAIRDLFNTMIANKLMDDDDVNSGDGSDSRGNSINATLDNFDSSSDNSSENQVNCANNNSEETNIDDSTYLMNYINDNVKKFPFYNEKTKNSKGKMQSKTLQIYISSREDNVYSYSSREEACSLFIINDNNSYLFSVLLYKDFVAKYKQFKNTYQLPNDMYNEDIINNIIKFGPNKKYTSPYERWRHVSPNSPGIASKIRTITCINDIGFGMRLIYDTYLRKKSIGFYAKCLKPQEPKILSDEEIKKELIDNPGYQYMKTKDGRYKYYSDSLQLSAFLTKDELTKVLSGRIEKITLTVKYKVSYNEDNILIYYGTNDDNPNGNHS